MKRTVDADTEPDHVVTTSLDGECVLRRDVTSLVHPLQLEAGTRLDCQGHQILPSSSGRPDDPLTPQFDPVFSQPQLAVFLSDVRRARGARSHRPRRSRFANTNPTGAVVVTQALGSHPQLWNVIIGGALYQLTFESSAEVNEDFTADNIVEGNDLSFDIASSLQAGSRESGVAAVGSVRTVVRGNDVARPTAIGIRDGQIAERRLFPGKCSLDSTRHCLADDDCSISGIDDLPKGTCVDPPPQPIDARWFARDFLIEDNEVQGPFRGGISINAENRVVRGNEIGGPLIPAGGFGGIVLRGRFGLETSVITDNRVANVSTALRFDKTFGLAASFFDARISRNDFTGYTIAVQTSDDYDLPSELSVDGSGNYWGSTRDDSGFDPTKVKKLNGALNPR